MRSITFTPFLLFTIWLCAAIDAKPADNELLPSTDSFQIPEDIRLEMEELVKGVQTYIMKGDKKQTPPMNLFNFEALTMTIQARNDKKALAKLLKIEDEGNEEKIISELRKFVNTLKIISDPYWQTFSSFNESQ